MKAATLLGSFFLEFSREELLVLHVSLADEIDLCKGSLDSAPAEAQVRLSRLIARAELMLQELERIME